MTIRCFMYTVSVVFTLAIAAPAQDPARINIDPFVATLDSDKDGSIQKTEWNQFGLMDIAFSLCDKDKDGKITRPEMGACAVPESMDPKKEGILTVYSGGRFVIPSPGNPIPRPANAPPGITQATQMVADSPYVPGGPTGEEFIRMFDANGDGKVDHDEWEKRKNDTVFKPYRWPQYNRNRDQWITVEEAPKAPVR